MFNSSQTGFKSTTAPVFADSSTARQIIVPTNAAVCSGIVLKHGGN